MADLNVILTHGSSVGETSGRIEVCDAEGVQIVVVASIARGQGADGKQYPFVKLERFDPEEVDE